MQKCAKILLFHIYNEVQHVSGDTPPIIRSLKLHWQPLVFHTWKVVGSVVGRRCKAQFQKPMVKIRLKHFCRSPAEIVGSNPTGGMDICLL